MKLTSVRYSFTVTMSCGSSKKLLKLFSEVFSVSNSTLFGQLMYREVQNKKLLFGVKWKLASYVIDWDSHFTCIKYSKRYICVWIYTNNFIEIFNLWKLFSLYLDLQGLRVIKMFKTILLLLFDWSKRSRSWDFKIK